MYTNRQVATVVFVDRKTVALFSTFYAPIPATREEWPIVSCRIDEEVTDLETSPIHKAYTEFMNEVDVVDHLYTNYSYQTRSHKWWHKIFFYLLDTSIVNCYIFNKVATEQLGKDVVSHL